MIFEGDPDARSFPAQTNGYGFVEAVNGIDDMGIKFDSFIFGVSQFPIRGERCQSLIAKVFGAFLISLLSESQMAGDKTQHPECYVFRFGGREHFLNHFGIRVSPIQMQNAGVDSEADAVAMFLTAFSCIETFIERGSAWFKRFNRSIAVQAPGDNRLAVRFEGKQVIDAGAFCEQH